MKSLAEIIDNLREAATEAATHSYLELRRSGDETVLRGNAAGLVQVALDALVLANSGKTGSHVHIDAASNADYAEGGLVIGVIDAPWA